MSLIERGDYWSLAECFLILLNIPMLKIAVMPPPSLPHRAGRSFGTPTEMSHLLSLLCMRQGAQKPCVLPQLRLFIPGALCPWCECAAVICSLGEDGVLLCGCCYGLDTVGLQGLQLAQCFLLFPPGGKWAGSVPTRGCLGLEDFAGKDEPFNNRMERWWPSTVIIVGTSWISETDRDLHSRNNDLTVTNGEDDCWVRGLGSEVGGEQQAYSSRKYKSATYSCPEQTPTQPHPQHCLLPISLWHSHALTCKPCSCCQFSGFGCHIWSQWMARWWHRFLPWPLCWPCPGSRAGSQLWPWLSKSSEKETRAKRTWILCEQKSSLHLNSTVSVKPHTDTAEGRAGLLGFKERSSPEQTNPEQIHPSLLPHAPALVNLAPREAARPLPKWLLLTLFAFGMLQKNIQSLKTHYFIQTLELLFSHVGTDENRVFWVVRKYKSIPGNQHESWLSATSRLQFPGISH